MKNKFFVNLTSQEKLKKALFFAVPILLFAYLFSVPSFSGRVNYNYLSIGLMGLLLGVSFIAWLLFVEKKKFHKRLLFLSAFIVWALIPTLIYTKEFREWLTIFLLVITFYVFYISFIIINDIGKVLKILTIAFFCFAIYFFIVYRNDLGNAIKTGERLGTYFDNENAVGLYAAIGIIASMFLVFKAKKKWDYLYLIPLLSFIGVGYFSGSRTFVVAFVVTLVVFLCIKLKNKPWILFGTIVGLIAIFFILINLPFMKDMKEKLLGSLYTIFGIKVETTTRLDFSTLTRILWQKFGIYLASINPITGYGAGGFSKVSHIGTYTHGEFAELLCNYGIVGFVLFFINFLIPIVLMGKSKNENKQIIIPIFVFYAVQLVLAIYHESKMTYLMLAIMFYIVSDVETSVAFNKKSFKAAFESFKHIFLKYTYKVVLALRINYFIFDICSLFYKKENVDLQESTIPEITLYKENDIKEEYDLHIIIPCYNGEKYIDKCINSIINQKTIFSIFVTVVNDGSTDNSLEVLKKYESKNLEIITKTNGGISSARNEALKNIKGKYIMFVDVDDYLADGSIDQLLKIGTIGNYDIVYGHTYYVDENGKILTKSSNDYFVTGVLYKNNIFKNLIFPEGYTFEDTIGPFLINKNHLKTIQSDVHNYYYYVTNAQSVSHLFKNYNKGIDSYYITVTCLKNLEKYGVKFEDVANHFMHQLSVNYFRCKGDEMINKLIFYSQLYYFYKYDGLSLKYKGINKRIAKCIEYKNYEMFKLANKLFLVK